MPISLWFFQWGVCIRRETRTLHKYCRMDSLTGIIDLEGSRTISVFHYVFWLPFKYMCICQDTHADFCFSLCIRCSWWAGKMAQLVKCLLNPSDICDVLFVQLLFTLGESTCLTASPYLLRRMSGSMAAAIIFQVDVTYHMIRHPSLWTRNQILGTCSGKACQCFEEMARSQKY